MLNLLRKRLLLELQIEDDDLLLIGNKEHTKNDILVAFKRLENLDALDLHLLIAANGPLIRLMENAKLPPTVLPIPEIEFQDDEQRARFIALVSAHLAYSFNKCVSKALKNSDYQPLVNAGPFIPFLIEEDFHFAFRKIRQLCESVHEEIASKLGRNEFILEDHPHLISTPFWELLMLCYGNFKQTIEVFSWDTIRLSIHFDKIGQSDFIDEMSELGSRMNTFQLIQDLSP
jgi:hypothetical protein